MEALIRNSPGIRNDLLVRIPREEIELCMLHIAHRDDFMSSPGFLRGPADQDPIERAAIGKLKEPVQEHLARLRLVDDARKPLRRVIAIGSRNVGNNRCFQAWQSLELPRHFLIRGDKPFGQPTTFLTAIRGAGLCAKELLVREADVAESDRDITPSIDWSVFANCVLRKREIVPIEIVADQFYDMSHLIAVDRDTKCGKLILNELYDGFDLRSRETIVEVIRRRCVPRNRFLHNALGLSSSEILILQREGTPEEIACWLREEGADDGFILDNGGSVFCWAWWVACAGGYLFQAPDFRPAASAVLAFVLQGAPYVQIRGGTVSSTIV